MDVNQILIKQVRSQRGWTQQQLADVADLSLRTVQRVESLGVASMETVNALCAVLEVEREELIAFQVTTDVPDSSKAGLAAQRTAYFLTFLAGFVLGAMLLSLVS